MDEVAGDGEHRNDRVAFGGDRQQRAFVQRLDIAGPGRGDR